MKCGFSKACITPEVGTIMGGTFEIKRAEGILDNLFVRAVSFDDGNVRSIIISFDLCLMSTDINDEIRARVSKENGIDIDAIMLTCTHTHSGPLTWGYESFNDNTNYTEEDIKRLFDYRELLIAKA